MNRDGWGQRAVNSRRAVTLALAVLLLAAGLFLAHIENAWTQAEAEYRLGCVCEGHGRGNLPLWSDDGVHWNWPPNMAELEAM